MTERNIYEAVMRIGNEAIALDPKSATCLRNCSMPELEFPGKPVPRSDLHKLARAADLLVGSVDSKITYMTHGLEAPENEAASRKLLTDTLPKFSDEFLFALRDFGVLDTTISQMKELVEKGEFSQSKRTIGKLVRTAFTRDYEALRVQVEQGFNQFIDALKLCNENPTERLRPEHRAMLQSALSIANYGAEKTRSMVSERILG